MLKDRSNLPTRKVKELFQLVKEEDLLGKYAQSLSSAELHAILKPPKPKRSQEEMLLHKAVCQYLTLQYPKVLFRSDSGGIFKTPAQAGLYSVLQSGRGHPDLMIIHGRIMPDNSFVAGIVIEFKKNEKEATKPCGKKKTEHLKEQQDMMVRYKEQHYWGSFCWKFDQAKCLIDKLLRHDKKENWPKKKEVYVPDHQIWEAHDRGLLPKTPTDCF